MKSLIRHRLLAYSVTGALAAGIIGGAGVVAAQTTEEGTPTATEHDGGGAFTFHRPLIGHGVGAIVEASGLDASVFRDGFADGKAINEILEENGVDPATVKAEVLAEFEARLDELMNTTPPNLGERPFLAPVLLGLHEAAEAIGIDAGELRQALIEGQTIAEVATEHGVDAQTVIDAMVAPGLERIDEAETEGDLTAEEAANARERLVERTTEVMNEGGPLGFPGFMGRRGHGFEHGRGGGFGESWKLAPGEETETEETAF